MSVTWRRHAKSLSDRQLNNKIKVLDNCEHVTDAPADWLEALCTAIRRGSVLLQTSHNLENFATIA